MLRDSIRHPRKTIWSFELAHIVKVTNQGYQISEIVRHSLSFWAPEKDNFSIDARGFSIEDNDTTSFHVISIF